jgi:hypothetical protein
MMPPPLRPQREHPRVPSDFPVKLQLGNTELCARARDLSMTGLYLSGALELPETVLVRIPLADEGTEVATTCRIERREKHGVAVSFAEIRWEDLLLLARYVSPRI